MDPLQQQEKRIDEVGGSADLCAGIHDSDHVTENSCHEQGGRSGSKKPHRLALDYMMSLISNVSVNDCAVNDDTNASFTPPIQVTQNRKTGSNSEKIVILSFLSTDSSPVFDAVSPQADGLVQEKTVSGECVPNVAPILSEQNSNVTAGAQQANESVAHKGKRKRGRKSPSLRTGSSPILRENKRIKDDAKVKGE